MTIQSGNSSDEAQIRSLIDRRVNAVRVKDASGAVSNVSRDVVSFDVVVPLQYVGLDALRKRAEEWFASFRGEIGYEIQDLAIAAGDDVAFSHGLNRYSGTKLDGGQLDMWVRVTVCYRKIGGQWLVTHEHSSVPFDATSGKAALDLKP